MRRLDIVAVALMLVLAIVWMSGCPRDDQISRTDPMVAPAPTLEAKETTPEESGPPVSAGTPGAPVATSPASAESGVPQAAPPVPPVARESPPVTSAPEPAPGPAPSDRVAETKPTPAPAQPAPASEPAPDEGTVVIGKITLVSHVPLPSEVPYKDCLTMIKYTVEDVPSGSYAEEELLAAFWGMKAAELQPAAKFQVGQRHRLVIEPLAEHPDLLRAMQADDTNEYSLSPQWVVSYSAP